MFKIDKNEPDFFKKAKSKVKKPKISNAWSSSEIENIRPKLRGYILLEEQNLLCAYCEKEIDDNPRNSNIDHFRLKAGHLFPEKTLDYNNLLVSCNTEGRCSKYKDKHIKSKKDYDNIINPVIENPNDFFDYLITGEIVAKNQKAKFTINIFQLDNQALIRQRKDIADTLEHIDLSLEEIYNEFGNEFHSFIRAIYPKLKQKGVTP
jgi:uncharacterized protein (TIGR02646 family)